MKGNKQVTIYDVAKKAGVSAATVSRVLNSPDMVGGEKKQKILDAIQELHFVPKADAVANARKSYKKIGVIAPFFTQPSFMERLRGVTNVLADEHYELVVYSIDTTEDLNNYISSLVTSHRVDGLILFCVNLNDSMTAMLKDAPFPVCFVENEVENFDCVVVENKKGGELAANFFLKKGCKNPGFIGEESVREYAVHATEERFEGYKKVFEANGIKIKDENVWVSEFTDQQLDEGINQFLNHKEMPDCVFCSSDLIAARFIHLARIKGVQIPQQISVLGFDGIDISEYIGLSSISQNLDESGKQAADLVLYRIKNPSKAVANIKLGLQIIERMTTK